MIDSVIYTAGYVTNVSYYQAVVLSVSRSGRHGGTSISWGLNCLRFWKDSTIISTANLSWNKRRRCGLPFCWNKDSWRKTGQQHNMMQCPEDSGRITSANDRYRFWWAVQHCPQPRWFSCHSSKVWECMIPASYVWNISKRARSFKISII